MSVIRKMGISKTGRNLQYKIYKRRVEIGKNKMSTINIIRNKLLSRIFAVVDRKIPYVDIMKYVA